MLRPGKWGTHVELLAASTYFQIPMYILKTSSKEHKWEVLGPLGPASRFRYQECPEVDTADINLPDHFELLHSYDCHYDSIVSTSGSPSTIRPTIIETHVDCTDMIID